MKARMLVCIASVLLLGACKPKAPEQPDKPPTPSALTALADADAPPPTLTSRINAGGRMTQYGAYFDGQQLTQITETPLDAQGPRAEYHFHGARLLKYSQSGTTTEVIHLELDEQGRVREASSGTRALAQTEIDAIRSRAQLLRSHALAQQAARMHAQS